MGRFSASKYRHAPGFAAEGIAEALLAITAEKQSRNVPSIQGVKLSERYGPEFEALWHARAAEWIKPRAEARAGCGIKSRAT